MSTEPERIPISKLEVTSLELLERVETTGEPLVVTRNGEPIARVLPPEPRRRHESRLGAFRDEGRILGDLVEPSVPAADWDAFEP